MAPASFFFVLPEGLGEDADVLTIAGTDGRFNTVVDRPLLLEGRRPDPDRADEVMVNPQVADPLGIEPGDSLSLASLTPEQMDVLVREGDPGEPAGPTVDVEVVGIGQFIDGLARDTPLLLLTPAFYEAHRDDIGHFDDILGVRLERGDRDLAAFRAGVARVVPEREGAIVEARAETASEVRNATDVQAVSLYVFAIVAALAGFVVIGQAIARHTALASVDQPVLRSLGFLPRERFLALLVPGVLVAIGGGGARAWCSRCSRLRSCPPASPARWSRPGLRRRLVRARARRARGRGCSSRPARRVGRVRRRPPTRCSARRCRPSRGSSSAWAGRTRHRRSSTGVRMALDPGRGRTAVPSGPRSRARSWASRPASWPRSPSAPPSTGSCTSPSRTGGAGTRASSGPARPRSWTRLRRPSPTTTTWTARPPSVSCRSASAAVPSGPTRLDPMEGGEFTTVLEGRAPTAADEVLVGSGTLDRLGADVGDSITAAGSGGQRRGTG